MNDGKERHMSEPTQEEFDRRMEVAFQADEAVGRYQAALDAGLSDHEAREDGWPSLHRSDT